MKTIPIDLQAHKDLETTTLCRLLLIILKDGTTKIGFTSLDIDVAYNNGDGSVTYRSAQGFTPSRISSQAGTSVDNADLVGILADLDTLGVTEEQVRAGVLDYADAWCYEINYNDLTTGRHEIIARGKLGQVTMDGEQFVAEFRSLMQILKQQITQVTSLTCRAKFGSQPIGTGGGAIEERYPCGKTPTWANYTVTAVDGTEPDRIFTASAMTEAASYYVPGVVEWLTGDNAGRQVDVAAFASDVVTMIEPVYFPVVIGDTFRIRQDCTKDWNDASHGCLYHWGSNRALHFRGEPIIPVGREGEILTPGAGL